MRTTLKDIRNATALGPADDVVAPQNIFYAADSGFSVVAAAFRGAQVDGREPHAVHLFFDNGVELESLLPADAEVIRSAADDEDTMLLARGLGYSLLTSTIGRPSIWVSASTRAQANAIAADLRSASPTTGGRAEPSPNTDDDRAPGQYL